MKRLLLFILLLIGLSAHSKDLDMFRLIGPVDSLCVEMDDAGLTWQIEYLFDEDGFLIEFDGIKVDADRNDNNQITDFIIEEDDEDGETVTIETLIEYDKSGKVIKTITNSSGEEWSESFIYDTKGLLIKRIYESVDGKDIFTYVYNKFDSMGNWTERHEKLDSINQIIIQTRHITYRGS